MDVHIAFLVDRFPDLSTTFIHNQITGLLERGHEVVIYAHSPGRQAASHSDVDLWGLAERTRYLDRTAAPPVRWIRLGRALVSRPRATVPLIRPMLSGSPHVAGAARVLRAALGIDRPQRFDAIHCHFGPNGNLAVLLRQLNLLHGPILTTFHGYDIRLAEPSNGRCYAPLREYGDRFLCISLYTKRRLQEWGFPEDRTAIHRMGIDTEHYRFREPRRGDGDTVQLLTVGNLVPVKGHEYALRAVAEARRLDPSLALRLRIVGEGPERDRLETLRGDLDLRDSVEIVGPLGRDAVRSELEAADLFLLPSLAEMTPVVLMEAQSVGLPVIATRVGAVDEVVRDGDSAVLVPPGDAARLAGALVDLARAPHRWGAMARSGRRHVETFHDVRELVSELEHLYRSAPPSSP